MKNLEMESLISFDDQERFLCCDVDLHHFRIFLYLQERCADVDFLQIVDSGLSSLVDLLNSDRLYYRPRCDYFGWRCNPISLISNVNFPKWIKEHHFNNPKLVNKSSHGIAIPMSENTGKLIRDVVDLIPGMEYSSEVVMFLLRYLLLIFVEKSRVVPIRFYRKLTKEEKEEENNKDVEYYEYNVFDCYDFPFQQLQ